jgi:hypothetical protein
MKLNKLWAALLATSFGLAATMSPTIAEAQNKKSTTKTQAAPAAAAAAKKKGIVIEPEGLKWGMSMKQVGEVIDAMLDAEYKPVYQKTSPGVVMKRLDAQLAEEKSAFRRSRIDFGKLPIATDSTPLKGEYSYLNGESMMTLSRKGEIRHFFFIKDSLWKIIKEVKFSEKGELGKVFKEAAVKLTASSRRTKRSRSSPRASTGKTARRTSGSSSEATSAARSRSKISRRPRTSTRFA